MKVSKKAVLGILLASLCVFFLGGKACKVSAATKEDTTIIDGVSIDGIDISNMTEEEAKEAIDAYVQGLQQKTVTVTLDGGATVQKTVGELGYTCDENSYIEEAAAIGKTGNLIKRYKEIKDVNENGLEYTLEFTLDQETVRSFVETECTSGDIPAVNATVSRSNGSFVYTDAVTGRTCNVDQTMSLIQESILTDWNQQDISVNAVIEEDEPQYAREAVEKVKNLLGSFTTNYASSTYSRKENVANGAKLINNSIVYPGETFSCYEVMSPFTTEHGYYAAGAYVNGMVEDSIGGGVCQVSTTLYNAVLYAELEVVQRAPHSMTVSYVDLAKDAAIAGTYKDLKFFNNLDYPILIEGITNGSTITFNIYGCETRDSNRKVEYESKMIQKIEHGADVITEDSSQPASYRKVTQSYHDGYVAELYKVVYVNGAEVSRTKINTSTYSASPNYITVGTKVAEQEKEDVEEDKNKDEDKDKEETQDKVEDAVDDKKPDTDSKDESAADTDKDTTEDTTTEDKEASSEDSGNKDPKKDSGSSSEDSSKSN